MSPKQKPLACGGRGPCCHIGYPHRHCEHCDIVIATASPWPYGLPFNPVSPSPFRFYQGLSGTGQNTAGNLFAQDNNKHLSYSPSPALPAPDHTCEVK